MKKQYGMMAAVALVALVVGVAVAASQLTASTTVFGQPTTATNAAGIGSTNLAGPGGVFVDAAGRAWVCDLGGNRVLVYSSTTDTVAKWALSTNNDTASSGAGTICPMDVAQYTGSSAQFVAVADSANGRVLVWVWSKDSTLNQVIGRSTSNLVGESMPAIFIGQYSLGGALVDSAQASTDSTYSLAARHATAVTFGAAASGDTVYLYVATDTSNTADGYHRVMRFALRDTWYGNLAATGGFVAATDGNGRESAVLSYSRTTAVPTSFGQAPKADALFGDTTGVTAQRFFMPWDLAFYNNALYVADVYNNRVVRFDTANYLFTGIDTAADGVYGQTSFTNNQAWFTGSETGLRQPAAIAVSSAGGLVVGDSVVNPVLGTVSGRVSVFDGSDTTKAQRWFGMDIGGNPLAYTAVANATTIAGTPTVATYSSSVLAVDPGQNRILVLTSAVSAAGGSSPAASDNSNCVIGSAVRSTGLQSVLPSVRSMRDSVLLSSFGRFFVEGYYAFGALFVALAAGLGLAASARTR